MLDLTENVRNVPKRIEQEDTRMRQAERRLVEIRGGRGGDGRPACTARMDYLTDRRSENSSFGYRNFGVIIGNGNGNWGN